MSEINSFKKDIKIGNTDITKNNSKDINQNIPESSGNFTNFIKEFKYDTDIDKTLIIKEVKLKDMLLSACYCCGQKKSNIYKILLNESMNIIIDKLDLFNIFRSIYSIENSNNYLNNSLGLIKMSDDCSKDLEEIIK